MEKHRALTIIQHIWGGPAESSDRLRKEVAEAGTLARVAEWRDQVREQQRKLFGA